MNRMKLPSIVAAGALGFASLLVAPSAQASTTITITDANCTNGGNANIGASITAAPGDILYFDSIMTDCAEAYIANDLVSNSSSIRTDDGSDTITPGINAYQVVSNTPAFSWIEVTLGPVLGTDVISILDLNGNNITEWSITIAAGGGGASSSSSPAPQTFELSLRPQDGSTCTNSSESGTGGTWITLPSASDCTPPANKPGATLLGWSTTPDFPVDIAQRQVDNGWGTYEIFNDSGRITAVFIPAGRATFLSGTNTLYPIWNK